ncbi:hypothetical protein HAX54_037671 [Datura stramonium]|uniref:Uncharacterized protein n=1 Tax=Datura stramonium TaxID=4076 RepID=A0ABS8VJV2_DATST|nr:hypothetical protein [Datura stramonium]
MESNFYLSSSHRKEARHPFRQVEKEEPTFTVRLEEINVWYESGHVKFSFWFWCGGWLETRRRNIPKNHLRWARIRVETEKNMPALVEVEDGEQRLFLLYGGKLRPRFKKKRRKVAKP